MKKLKMSMETEQGISWSEIESKILADIDATFSDEGYEWMKKVNPEFAPDYEYEQLSFTSFNTSCGMQLAPQNEWIRISKQLPWRAWESLYSLKFTSETGNVAKPCRMVMGALIIQTHTGLRDRDLVDQLTQNPYYQYFIGLEAFQHDAPFSRTRCCYIYF